jgi:hypothetical protein
MRKYLEYLFILIAMLPVMISATRLTMEDTSERGDFIEAMKTISLKAQDVATHAPDCNMAWLSPRSYTAENGRELEVVYVPTFNKPEEFTILFNGKFRDGYRFQVGRIFKFEVDPTTKLCILEQLALLSIMNKEKDDDGDKSNRFGFHFDFDIKLPTVRCE